MSIIGTIYEDVTTDVVGSIGTWQWLVTFISMILMTPSLLNQYEDMFLLNPSSAVCVPPQGLSILNSSLCSITVSVNGTEEDVKCNKWHVKLVWLIWLKKSASGCRENGTFFIPRATDAIEDKLYRTFFTGEWNVTNWLLFCDQKLKLLSTAIVCRFGLVFGCVIFGSLADSFGRKTALYVGIGLSSCLELVLIFCDSQGWFRLFVFFKSVSASASLFMGLVLTCEIASNRWRSTLNTIVMTPRLLATVCAVPLANTAPNTETYGFASCLFCVVCIITMRWYPESPQWLLHNRKIEFAEITIKKAATMNGIQLCRDFKIRPVNHRAYYSLDEPTTCVGALTTPNTRFIFLVTSSFWAVFYFLWSSLYVESYGVERSGGLLIKVFCFIGLLSCLTILASMKLTFKYMLIIHIVLTGATTISIVCFRKGTIQTVASAIALSAGIMVHSLILNITPRLFATNIRGIACGCCHASGQIGSTVSYILFLLEPRNEITYLVVVTAATITLVGLCLVLPNVDGRELPDVLEDMNYYSELSKPLRWATQKTNSPSEEEIEMRVYSFGSSYVATCNTSNSRLPPRSIGFTSLKARIANYLRKKLARTK